MQVLPLCAVYLLSLTTIEEGLAAIKPGRTCGVANRAAWADFYVSFTRWSHRKLLPRATLDFRSWSFHFQQFFGAI